MFAHSLKYAFKVLAKNKAQLIWTLIFPIALCTFMYMAFGKIYESDMVFSEIPIDVVTETKQPGFHETLDELSSGDKPLLITNYTDEETALDDLKEGNIVAIVYEKEDIEILVAKSDYSQEVVRSIIGQYKKTYTLMMDLISTNPAAISELADDMSDYAKAYASEQSTGKGNQNVFINYFYAIFAMSCLFSCFGATDMVSNFMPNQSALGMRRNVSAASKTYIIMAEFIVLWCLTFFAQVLTLGYMKLIGVDLDFPILPALINLLAGSGIGLGIGVLIGCIPKLGKGSKSGIAVAFSMTLSVMADLCASGVKDSIEHNCPIINRLSPAALITDSFYALNVYDTYERYTRNTVTLFAMTIVCLTVSFIILRRNKSASL